MPKEPKYVNMNIKAMKDIYYNIEWILLMNIVKFNKTKKPKKYW